MLILISPWLVTFGGCFGACSGMIPTLALPYEWNKRVLFLPIIIAAMIGTRYFTDRMALFSGALCC